MKKSHDQVERENMGMDHGEVGGLVLNLWNLPRAWCRRSTGITSPSRRMRRTGRW